MRIEIGRRESAAYDIRIALAAELKIFQEHMLDLNKYAL